MATECFIQKRSIEFESDNLTENFELSQEQIIALVNQVSFQKNEPVASAIIPGCSCTSDCGSWYNEQ